jgi:hypothetical protein
MQATQPRVLGSAPPLRFRHAAVLVDPPAGSPLRSQLASELPGGLCVDQGDVLLLVCGSGVGQELHGGERLPVLWVALDGGTVFWSECSTTGEAPGPRAQHTASAYCKGRRVVLLGPGAGEAGVEPEAAPAVYCLDLGCLRWSRRQTSAASPADNPGWRLLHMAAVHSRPGGDSSGSGVSQGMHAQPVSSGSSRGCCCCCCCGGCGSGGGSGGGCGSGCSAEVCSATHTIGSTGGGGGAGAVGAADSGAAAAAAAAAAGTAGAAAAAAAAGEGGEGRDELVVLGGTVLGALVEMVPFALCLATFCWRRSPGARLPQRPGSPASWQPSQARTCASCTRPV